MTQINKTNQNYKATNSTIEGIILWISSIISRVRNRNSKGPKQNATTYYDSTEYHRQRIRKEARDRINKAKNQIYRQW